MPFPFAFYNVCLSSLSYSFKSYRDRGSMINASDPVKLVYLPAINFALQQNQVPVIRELILTNTSEEDWQDVVVELSSDPLFTIPWKRHVESLGKGTDISIRNLPVQISAEYLAGLTEKISAHFLIRVMAGDELLAEQAFPVEILAYDQWSGLAIMPENLAAFVTPNHPEIAGIIRRASVILQKWTGSPSFDDYQTRNPDRVRKQIAAIYEVIASEQFIYCSVPASFEESGQRVRLADTIFLNRLANCLDLSLLYAACLEAVGIHPLIVIIKGHAFAGAWLADETFADAVNDDPSLITKRSANGIHEIAIVESTCMNAGHHASFDEASLSAEEKMRDTKEFLCFIDVKRARFAKIIPLPLRILTQSGWEIVHHQPADREGLLPDEISAGAKLVEVPVIDVTKQRLWERKLLDLTLRNSLLNIRITKSVVQFMTTNIGAIEDALANGDEFQVLGRPLDWENGIRETGLYQALHKSDPVAELLTYELTQKRIRSYLPDTDLTAALTTAYRAARLSIEENGANTLYVAVGLLKWYETDVSEKARYAPILLIPVEILRKTSQRGFVIRSREEESIVNITMLEMLRHDFDINIGGLDLLPKDGSGVDVRSVLNAIRQAVMTKSRWDVEEQALLGNFSFSKFILWNDIHNNADELAKNKVVASLLSGKLEWQAEENVSSDEIMDARLHPEEIALPISTDSSQLQAILSAAKGRSFVLHGPPGTGKSQTITNIIANALYNGKRVLFVAAKKAALDVVEQRLESIGIGSFCLELHSNKSKKSVVLDQLKQATQAVKTVAPENFREEAQRLFSLRNELNIYVEALHKRYPFGYSLFDIFEEYSRLPEGEDKVFFDGALLENTTAANVADWNDIVSQLQTAGQLITHPQGHPLAALAPAEFSNELKQRSLELVQQYNLLLNQFQKESSKVADIMKLRGVIADKEQEEVLVKMVRMFFLLDDVPASLVRMENPEQTILQLQALAKHGIRRDELQKGLLAGFQKEVLRLPAEQMLSEWNIAAGKWLLPRWLNQNSLIKQVSRLSLSGNVPKEAIPDLLNMIIEFQEEVEAIDKAKELQSMLGFLWKNGECNWKGVESISEAFLLMNRLAGSLKTGQDLRNWRLELSNEFSEGSNAYKNYHKAVLENYLTSFDQLQKAEQKLTATVGINFTSLHVLHADWKVPLLEISARWIAHMPELKQWFNWTQIRKKAIGAGLQPLLSAYEQKAFETEHIELQYRRGFLKSAAEYIIAANPQLASFNGTIFNDRIKRFKELSKQFESLTKKELYARLAANMPSFTQEAAQSSEIGILQRALRSNARGTSIRKLFDQIPNLLSRLTPCMLMSPISVAQYFEADGEKFDLVIFDEASQMPTCEAVGAIARGTNVIVVGDPKQMPPTSFFSVNNIDEDNLDKEDLESILDDCLSLSMPSQYLLWHYRSRHESLIAFSNAKFYDNKLLTFPSIDDITSRVQFVHVAGHYDKGKTRQNRFEARAIVDEIIFRLSDPILQKKSIGVVTFSSVQQGLIEDMLTEVFATRPDLEKKALEAEESLFIKNLENVQGDERDVILFSVCYGPDETGRLSLNFGPINREGGWRRLNVAVSRARHEMKVFSTLKSDQINLNRSGSEGVAALKAFLSYAEKGKEVLPIPSVSKMEKESGFEHIIADDIREAGYTVHTNIGCSDYKIDIAVVDKTNPSKYILGILTDGKNYFRANTSKDREIIQLDVLKALGWNIHKVWSTEWWEHPGKVKADIRAAIAGAEEGNAEIELPLPVSESQTLNSSSTAVTPQISAGVDYVICHLETVRTKSSDEFLLPQNQMLINSQILKVLSVESPISKNLICRRILSAWNISRMGSRVTSHFQQLFANAGIKAVSSGGNEFFWKNPELISHYKEYRIPVSDAEKREAEDIPPQEVSNAIREVLRNQISLTQNDLVRETAKLFGFARTGGNVEAAMMAGLAYAVENGFARWTGERVVAI